MDTSATKKDLLKSPEEEIEIEVEYSDNYDGPPLDDIPRAVHAAGLTTVTLNERHAALVTYPGGQSLIIPEEMSTFPQHALCLLGVYLLIESDDAFVEKTVRYAMDWIMKNSVLQVEQ